MNTIFSKTLRLIATLLPLAAFAEDTSLSLAGAWRFQLDPGNVGIAEKWQARSLADTVQLPGTTDTNQKGKKLEDRPTDRLVREWSWIGPAWYQREVTIPDDWAGKRITLFFERTKNCRVWIGDQFAGGGDSLSTPHEYDLTKAVKPGTHTITVLIDNARLPPIGPAHQVDERTQTNWNGIVGRMELRATDPVWIDDARIYPVVSNRTARVVVVIGNRAGKSAMGTLSLACASYNVESSSTFKTQVVPLQAQEGMNTLEFVYQPGEGVPLWDEFQPALLKLDLKLETKAGDGVFSDERSVRFGMREFTRSGAQLLINGRPVFLRGRLDCANYPITGYAPMSLDEWRRIFRITNEWGINHYRFHSWCPPAAAFEAADELGVYLQAELPNKRSAFKAPDSKDASVHNIDFMTVESTEKSVTLYEYGKREGEAIFRHFGNSPSFTMFTLGNELGRNPGMYELVAHFKKLEPRALHAQGANNMHWEPSLAEGDDFWITGKVGKDEKPLRGSFSLFDFPNPHIETRPPSTMVDYRASLEGVAVPLIGHETGQFQVFPDFRDIPMFTGVLKARNYEIFRERLEKTGMIDQALDFVRASGALSAICYREDIEAALRTPGFGGFQLLDIMDFPGQGTALVGMLNVFMESKGVIDPKDWLEFCSATVPLFRMDKFSWVTGETLAGEVQIAHYGPKNLSEAVVRATVTNRQGEQISAHTFSAMDLPAGGLRSVGQIKIPLDGNSLKVPEKLTLTLEIKGTSHRNRYPIWVYAPSVDTAAPKGVRIATSFASAETRGHLAAGGKVLLLPKLDKLPHSVPGGYHCEFWSPMFAESAKKRGDPVQPPGTLGLLCDPAHPALARFPTEFHSNWQWWHLVKNSRPIAYDGSPGDFRPFVQVIDNFTRNHKLGLIAETRVGKGAMLICAIDLQAHQDKPEARQMLHSLLRYMDSPDFAPKHELAIEFLETILPE